MSEKKSILKKAFTNIKITIANKIASRNEEKKIIRHERQLKIKAFFDKEERAIRKKNKVKSFFKKILSLFK